MPELREYQQRAIADVRAQYAAGRRAPCLVLPTGAGKTVVASEMIRLAVTRGNKVLFLVHRHELLNQSVAKLESAGVTDLRIIQAGQTLGNPTAPVTVASIPTLTRRDQMPDANLIIPDEAHHVVAKTWARIIERYPSALILGLTATPERSDGRPLGDIFDSLVVGATVRELTDLGHLVPCRVFAPPLELEAAQIALSVSDAYLKHADDQRAVVFCMTVEHARRVCDELIAAGVSAAVISGDMSKAERGRVLGDLDAGRIRAVCSIGVLTEGWDSPAVAVCILARKPQHTGLFLQMAGRVLRPSPSKSHATLVDLCGSVHDHGPPDLEREYSLDGKAISKVDRDAIRQCLSCGGVFRAGPFACPLCGVELPRRELKLPTSTGIGVVELDKLPRLPPRPITISLTAKYPGVCRGCAKRIAIGQQIYWVKGSGARHANCEEVAA